MSKKRIIYNNDGVYYLSCSAIAEGIGKSLATVSNIIKKYELDAVKKGRFNLMPINDVAEFKAIIDDIDNYKIVDIDADVTPKSKNEIRVESQSTVAELESKINQLQSQNNELQTNLQNRQSEITEAKRVNRTNVQLIEQLKKQLQEKETALTTVSSSVTETEGTASRLQEDLKVLRDTIERLKKLLADANENIKDKVEQVTFQKEVVAELKTEISNQNQSLNRYKYQLLVNAVNFAGYYNKTEGTAPVWDDKIELTILGAVKGFVRLVEKTFNILNSNPATFVVLALVFAIWEGTYQGKVMHRPGLAIVIQLTAVLVAIFNLTKKEERRIAKQIAKKGKRFDFDEQPTPWLLIGLAFYNFSLTYLSFIHYTDLAGDWKNSDNQFNALFSHHGNYVAIGLSIMFAVIVSGCINIYVKKSVK